MKIIARPRCKGKSTQLMYLSDITKTPIVVLTNSHKKRILEEAKKLSLNIPEPIVFTDDISDKIKKYEKVYVDDAEYILNSLLGSRVEIITVSKEE